MADADSYPQRLEIPPKRLVSGIGSSIPQNQENPSKFYIHVLYKVVLVAVVILLLPLFPFQAPGFINQSVLTRSWELLHLLFVGIAISYGLFSRRNDETEKENQSKIDSTQTYVSRMLQVSSVFDDEVDSPSGSEDNKIQTWNSQYFRGEPVVVVAPENSVLREQSNTNSNKPLLLPVRSLRSRVSDPEDLEPVTKSGASSGSLSRSGSGMKGVSSNRSDKTRNGEIGYLDPLDLEEKLKESVVLPSPIPWRSRSGRMEVKEVVGVDTPPLYSLPPSAEESEFDRLESRSHRSPVSWSSQPSSTSPSPKKLSPSPSLSPEMRAKNVDDLGRKKSFYKSSPPPPPPPPPVNRKSPSITLNPSPISDGFLSERRDVKKSFTDELKDLSRNTREDLPSRRDSGLDSLHPEAKSRTHIDGSSMGKSVRKIRASEPIAEVRKVREVGGDRMDEKTGKRAKEVEAVLMEKTGREAGEYNQMLINTEKPSRESPLPTPKPTFSKYQKEEKKEKQSHESPCPSPKSLFSNYSKEEIMVESDEDLDCEADDIQGSLDTEEATSNSAGLDPNEVDKKADEFIAKFREQIRLQRIASIKRVSQKPSTRNSSR